MTSRGSSISCQFSGHSSGWRLRYLMLLLMAFLLHTSFCLVIDGYKVESRVGSPEVVEERVEGDVYRERTVRPGSRVSLRCRPENVVEMPQIVSVVWYFNNLPIDRLQNPRVKAKDSRVWPRLTLKKIREEDKGVYACRWRSLDRHWGWVNYTVMVQGESHRRTPHAVRSGDTMFPEDHSDLLLPVFIKNLYVRILKPAGNRAELKCIASGPNLSTTWFKNGGKPLRELGDVRIKGFTLRMEDLLPSDSGNFTCVVSNEYGSINHTFILEVIEVLALPPIFTKHMENMTATIGSTVSFEVNFWTKNTITPYLVWARDVPFTWSPSITGEGLEIVIDEKTLAAIFNHKDKPIPPSASPKPEKFVLANVTEKDAGWYTCVAANSLGFSSSTAYLAVTDGSAIKTSPAIQQWVSGTTFIVVLCLHVIHHLETCSFMTVAVP